MHIFSDPPGMPEDERMTDAEFRLVREFLGLTVDALAAHLGVSGKTVRNWEAGTYPIPDGVRLEIEKLEATTGAWVGQIIGELMDLPDPVVEVYRNDEHYRTAHPRPMLTASWHRAVIARVAQEVPALSIRYAAASPAPPDHRRGAGEGQRR